MIFTVTKNFMSGHKDTLIVLDLDGVLVKRVRPTESKSTTDKSSGKIDGINSIVAKNGSIVYFRDGLEIFITWLFNNYSVAIFTSMTYHNAKELIDAIFTPDQIKQLVFIWDRSRCQLHPDYRTNPDIAEHDTCKVLSDIWTNAVVNKDRRWNCDNVIMVDDTRKKMMVNSESNYILVSSFDPTDKPHSADRSFAIIMGQIVTRTQYANLVKVLAQTSLDTK